MVEDCTQRYSHPRLFVEWLLCIHCSSHVPSSHAINCSLGMGLAYQVSTRAEGLGARRNSTSICELHCCYCNSSLSLSLSLSLCVRNLSLATHPKLRSIPRLPDLPQLCLTLLPKSQNRSKSRPLNGAINSLSNSLCNSPPPNHLTSVSHTFQS